MKEWDRRPSERQGFANTAADCLAFKYMRDVSAGRRLGSGRLGNKTAGRASARMGAAAALPGALFWLPASCVPRSPLSSKPTPFGLTPCQNNRNHPQAYECRFPEDAYAKLDLADAAATSDGAAARLAAARAEIEEAHAAKAAASGGLSSSVMLTLLRLSPDELGVRPLPQLSDLGAATAADLAAAPAASQEGAFGAFTIGAGAAGSAHKWVALPQWKALSLARRPAALPIADCARNAAVVAASQCKTDEDKRRMTGPGLLVVDAHVEGELDPKGYYLIPASPEGGVLQLVDGAAAAARGAAPAAAVLFLARPPARDNVAASTAELLQV